MLGIPASSILRDDQAQVIAQNCLTQARSQKTVHNLDIALILYDQAKVAFKNIADTHQVTPVLSELKSAFAKAQISQAPEEEALRRHIAEVYFERGELLAKLGKADKAQASYKKAHAWGYEGIDPAWISVAPLSATDTHALTATSVGTPMQQLAVASSAQEKSVLVDYLFEKALSTLGSLEVSHKPSLFLVYAHNNPAHGEAKAETSKYLIDKLSTIRVNLYSDQTPMGKTYFSSPEDLKDHGKLEDILTSQLCLLPTQLQDDVRPVDKVVVCCSAVLASYLTWPHYESFCQALQNAYEKDSQQKSTSFMREVVRQFSQAALYQSGFHHVLTEMAFLQIRATQLKDRHGIIPVSLTPNSYDQCLKRFITSTTVRLEDIPRFEEQAQAGKEIYPNQSRHWVLFKLIERLLVGSDEARIFLNKFWNGYSNCLARLKDESALGKLEFVKLVDGILYHYFRGG